MLADKYVFEDLNKGQKKNYQEPVVYPDTGIWHPLSMTMFEDVKSYLTWHNNRPDISDDLKDPPRALCRFDFTKNALGNGR